MNSPACDPERPSSSRVESKPFVKGVPEKFLCVKLALPLKLFLLLFLEREKCQLFENFLVYFFSPFKNVFLKQKWQFIMGIQESFHCSIFLPSVLKALS